MFQQLTVSNEANNALDLQAMRTKFGGKKGLYDWLTTRGKLILSIALTIRAIYIERFYMPSYAQTTLKHCYRVLSGEKLALRVNQLVPYTMPKFDEFKLEKLVTIAKSEEEIWKHIPELETANSRHCRKYITTIIASLRPEYFKEVTEHAYR